MTSAKETAIDYALGAGGGLVYLLSQAIFGSGFIGSLIGAVIAGSVIKGTRGTILATLLGFMALAGIGQSSSASASQSTDTRGVM